MSSITVLVADDHPIVRRGIVTLLDAEPDIDVIAEAENGREAVERAIELTPLLTIMDLRMPEMDGVEAIGAIRARMPHARLLVLTTYDSDESIVRAVEAGASGYLLKDAPPDELLDAVRRAAAGETVYAAPVTARLVEHVRAPTRSSLTTREIEVLREVADGNTNAVIARRLFISEATVKTHLLHIYAKLTVADRAAAVARAYERGILGT